MHYGGAKEFRKKSIQKIHPDECGKYSHMSIEQKMLS